MRQFAARRVARPLLLCLPTALLAGASGCVFTTDSEHGFHFQIGTSSRGTLGHQAAEERRLRLDLVSGDQLVLEGMVADVELRAGGRDRGDLVAMVRADGRTQEEAETALQEVGVEVVRDGSVVTVRVQSDPRTLELSGGGVLITSARADLSAALPPDVRVLIREASGEIEVAGPVAGVEAHTAYGDVSVSRIVGRTVISSGSGDLSVRDARDGDVSATTNFGDVVLADVQAGSVEVESSSGDVELRKVDATRIRVRSSFGGLDLERLSGDVDAETASGDVDLSDGANARYRLHSNFGQVTVERVSGEVRATSDSGEVEVACDGIVEARSRFGRVRVEGVLRAVDAASDSGDVLVIALPGSRAERDWSATSGFGEVVLRIASDFACRIDARTEFGDVDDEFELVHRDEGSTSIAGGPVGGGGEGAKRVVLHTGSGDIEILRRD